jgi:hypothetical protein
MTVLTTAGPHPLEVGEVPAMADAGLLAPALHKVVVQIPGNGALCPAVDVVPWLPRVCAPDTALSEGKTENSETRTVPVCALEETHTHTHTRTGTRTHTRAHRHRHTRTHAHRHTGGETHRHTYTHTHTHSQTDGERNRERGGKREWGSGREGGEAGHTKRLTSHNVTLTQLARQTVVRRL